MNKLYRFLQIFLRPFYRIFFGMRVIGRENELASGPCIICANHISMHDIILIALNLKRQIFFFAKKELFKNPLFAKILRSFGTISVSRGTADIHAIAQTIDVLKAGGYIGLFPQGTRMPGRVPTPADAKSGVGLMAYRAKSSVLPVYIQTKNNRIRLFRRVTVIIGKPIRYEELGFSRGTIAEYNAASKLIFERICELGAKKETEDAQNH